MKKVVYKNLIRIGLPVLGLGVIAGGTIGAIAAAKPAQKRELVEPNKISLSCDGLNVIKSNPTEKSLYKTPITVNVEPADATKDVKFNVICTKKIGADSWVNPNKIHIDNNKEIVIDKGLRYDWNQSEWAISATYTKQNGEIVNCQSPLSFKMDVENVESDIIAIDWEREGSNFLQCEIGQSILSEKPWVPKVQCKNGSWSVGGASFSIIGNDTEIPSIISINDDGYFFMNTNNTKAGTYKFKIKATSLENDELSVLSPELTLVVNPGKGDVASLEWINGTQNITCNYNTTYEVPLDKAFIVAAYDKNGNRITSPEINYSILDIKVESKQEIDNPNSLVGIDSYGIIRVYASRISAFTTFTCKVRAYSYDKDGKLIYIDQPIKGTITDTSSDGLFIFNPVTGVIEGYDKINLPQYLANRQGALVLPTDIDGAKVNAIGMNAFQGLHGLTSITIPDGISQIGEGAFIGCESLTRAAIGKNVELIGEKAFYNCTALSDIVINGNVKTYGKGCFSTRRNTTGTQKNITKITTDNQQSVANLLTQINSSQIHPQDYTYEIKTETKMWSGHNPGDEIERRSTAFGGWADYDEDLITSHNMVWEGKTFLHRNLIASYDGDKVNPIYSDDNSLTTNLTVVKSDGSTPGDYQTFNNAVQTIPQWINIYQNQTLFLGKENKQVKIAANCSCDQSQVDRYQTTFIGKIYNWTTNKDGKLNQKGVVEQQNRTKVAERVQVMNWGHGYPGHVTYVGSDVWFEENGQQLEHKCWETRSMGNALMGGWITLNYPKEVPGFGVWTGTIEARQEPWLNGKW